MQDNSQKKKDKTKKTFLKFFMFSAIAHIALFFIFIQSPFQAAERVKLPPSINVNLKTFAKPVIKKKSIVRKKIIKKKKSVIKKKVKKKIKRKIKKKKIIVKKKKNVVNLKKNKKSVKKKTNKKKKKVENTNGLKNGLTPDEKLKKARDRLLSKLSKDNKLDDVYKRLRKTVKKESIIRETEISNKAKALGKIRAERIKEYQNHIALIIEKNWSYNKQISKQLKSLETLIVFKVMPDGSIKDINFEKESDDDYLNESAYKAIIKSNPVSPHPKNISENYILIPLKFTPTGIK
ncbi:MAG: TonB C-terminal domain-containing protein [Deltaproteobacteria bacterium]|nr:TonB C-terminal domain-containing protein [Deltaproteobacteria bacterium]